MINTIINDDCRNVFPKIKKQYNNFLILTDPPYNINFKGYDNYNDNLSDDEYIELLGIFKYYPVAIIHYPEEMMKYVVPALGVPHKVLSWCYNSNIPRRFRLINIYHKEPDFKKVLQPYKNINDKRVQKLISQGKKGTPLYEWFDDIQIVKNVSKEKTDHPCQIPIKLMERIITLLTEEGDLIIDPFCGSGSSVIAAKNLKRNYIGIEKSEKYYNLILKRINSFEENIF